MAWQEYQTEQTLDLIEYMRMVNPKDREASDDAFRAFIIRFREYLQRLCRRVASSYGYDSYVGDEVAEETFRKFRGAKSFSPEKCKTKNIDKCIKLYLSRTAYRAFADHYRQENNRSPFTGDEEPVYDLPMIDDLDLEPERLAILKKKDEILRDILYNRLSRKHRVIYLTYKQYELIRRRESEDGSPQKYNLPTKLLDRLASELEIAKSTIRKYYQDANAIIEPLLALYGNK
jgi:DNA-directed RNA polymerase specialized sigma24 family protein